MIVLGLIVLAVCLLIAGAETWRTRSRLRKLGTKPDWTRQDDSVPEAPARTSMRGCWR